MSPSDKPRHVVIMVPGSQETLELDNRRSAETHVLKDTVRELAVERKVDSDKLRLNIQQSMSQVSEILSTVGQKVREAWEIQSVTVGLSVNAEGSVGIAAAGVDSSLDVTFTPRKKTEELGF